MTGQGLEELEEALLLQAELMELGASRSRRAEAVVIEAKVDKGHGPVATVVVKRGTLKVGGRRQRGVRRAACCGTCVMGCCMTAVCGWGRVYGCIRLHAACDPLQRASLPHCSPCLLA